MGGGCGGGNDADDDDAGDPAESDTSGTTSLVLEQTGESGKPAGGDDAFNIRGTETGEGWWGKNVGKARGSTGDGEVAVAVKLNLGGVGAGDKSGREVMGKMMGAAGPCGELVAGERRGQDSAPLSESMTGEARRARRRRARTAALQQLQSIFQKAPS